MWFIFISELSYVITVNQAVRTICQKASGKKRLYFKSDQYKARISSEQAEPAGILYLALTEIY